MGSKATVEPRKSRRGVKRTKSYKPKPPAKLRGKRKAESGPPETDGPPKSKRSSSIRSKKPRTENDESAEEANMKRLQQLLAQDKTKKIKQEDLKALFRVDHLESLKRAFEGLFIRERRNVGVARAFHRLIETKRDCQRIYGIDPDPALGWLDFEEMMILLENHPEIVDDQNSEIPPEIDDLIVTSVRKVFETNLKAIQRSRISNDRAVDFNTTETAEPIADQMTMPITSQIAGADIDSVAKTDTGRTAQADASHNFSLDANHDTAHAVHQHMESNRPHSSFENAKPAYQPRRDRDSTNRSIETHNTAAVSVIPSPGPSHSSSGAHATHSSSKDALAADAQTSQVMSSLDHPLVTLCREVIGGKPLKLDFIRAVLNLLSYRGAECIAPVHVLSDEDGFGVEASIDHLTELCDLQKTKQIVQVARVERAWAVVHVDLQFSCVVYYSLPASTVRPRFVEDFVKRVMQTFRQHETDVDINDAAYTIHREHDSGVCALLTAIFLVNGKRPWLIVTAAELAAWRILFSLLLDPRNCENSQVWEHVMRNYTIPQLSRTITDRDHSDIDILYVRRKAAAEKADAFVCEFQELLCMMPCLIKKIGLARVRETRRQNRAISDGLDQGRDSKGRHRAVADPIDSGIIFSDVILDDLQDKQRHMFGAHRQFQKVVQPWVATLESDLVELRKKGQGLLEEVEVADMRKSAAKQGNAEADNRERYKMVQLDSTA